MLWLDIFCCVMYFFKLFRVILCKVREWFIDLNCFCNLLIVFLVVFSVFVKVVICCWRFLFCLFFLMMRILRLVVLVFLLWIFCESFIVDFWFVVDEFGIGLFCLVLLFFNWCMCCFCWNNLDFNFLFFFNVCFICLVNFFNFFWDGMFIFLVLM